MTTDFFAGFAMGFFATALLVVFVAIASRDESPDEPSDSIHFGP